ncbi:MAG: hypothetical protein U1A77_13875 [Pirellulales bacterium]
MTGQNGIVREISWRDIFPWLVLFRTNFLALRASVLFVACLGTLAAPLGWRLAESLWLSEEALQDSQFRGFVEQQRAWPTRITPSSSPVEGGLTRAEQMVRHPLQEGLGAAWRRLVGPFRVVFQAGPLGGAQCLYLLTGILWSLMVWGFVGGTIARVAVVNIGLEEDPGIVNSITFAWRRLRSLAMAPVLPLPVMMLFSLPVVLLGWLMRYDAGVLLGGLLWFFVLLVAFAVTWLLVGLVLGWPFMPAVIVTEEGGDHFEAFHRSYSYVYNSPLHYAFFWLLAGLLGLLGCWTVDTMADTTLQVVISTVSLGSGQERWRQIADVSGGGDADGMLWAGGRLIGFFEQFLGLVTTAFRYAIFFMSTATIYLLLRQQVDDAELDEVCRDADSLDEDVADDADSSVDPSDNAGPTEP